MSDDRVQFALELRAQGYGYKRIGRALGVSPSTVRRWVLPGAREANLLASREAKRRRTGTCVDCGGVTRYNGHGRESSERCASCSRAKQMGERKWTREAVIDAIQRWAAEHGRPPSASDWNYRSEYKTSDFPWATQVYRGSGNVNAPFAYWADAIEAAGFPRPRVGAYDRSRRKVAA